MNLSPGTALGANGPGQPPGRPLHSPLVFSDGKVQPLDSPLVSDDEEYKDGDSKSEEDGEDADLVETKFLL